MLNVQLRQATKGDVHEMIPLIYSSGPDSFDYVFKTNKYAAQDFLKYAFESGKGEFGYRNHYAVEQRGKVIGSAAVLTGAETAQMTQTAIFQIISFYGIWTGLKVMLRGLRTETVIKPPKGEEQLLVHLGVHPDHRGKGVGGWMIEQLLRRLKVHHPIGLDVSVENPRAKALYSRKGFKVKYKVKSPYKNQYGKVADHERMFYSA
ncbi:N-acetyltransferase [Algivirga pacifica]|uniref:N-acetyltransferase domain-containing protein n=1 Tax=Algivirga pacifica TaxID=1162670 RepID=A0ABP9DK11_9BACT